MSRTAVLEHPEAAQLKQDIPEFHVGDTIKVHLRLREGNKERIQVFQGTVIARKGGGLSETFSLHRVAYGGGMERVFLLHSPLIAKIEVIKEGDVRRAKLYYLRGTSGKKSRVKGRVQSRAAKRAAKASALQVNQAAEPQASAATESAEKPASETEES
jgi:large subunit ribosomal protein L19